MMHELEVAIGAGALGSIDANTGDYLLGWDTDQFPTNIYLTTQCMLCILGMGGFTTGGVNFDAKVRRESFEPIDLFYAHIGGMDAFARGLKIAQRHHRRRPAGRVRQGTLPRAGTASSAAASKPARPASATSKPTSSPRATPPRTSAAARRCSRT